MLVETMMQFDEKEKLSYTIVPKKIVDDDSEEEATSLNDVDCYSCVYPSHTVPIEDNSKFSAFLQSRKLRQILTWLLVLPMLWMCLYSITGNEALPKGNLFSIICLLVLAQVGGSLLSKLKLPPLLGMLVIGIVLKSVPHFSIIADHIDPKWSATLRKMALVIILTRAGLGLDPKALRQLSFMVIRLGILPNLLEMCIVAAVSHFLLTLPWLWSFLLGFIISGVSPSVVVPCMLSLSDRGLGVDKGVPTLVIAGLSIDNVLSITGFGVILGVIFSDGSVMWQAFKGPIEVLIGLGYGCLVGYLSWHLPHPKSKSVTGFRFIILIVSNLIAIFGSVKIGFGGAGPIACLANSFVAGIGWRRLGWTDDKNPVKKHLGFLWQFFLPLLFGLIGSEVKITALDGNTVQFGILTLLVGLFFRVAMSYFCVTGGELNIKERIFVALAWLPKATVQAAIGSTALDMARSLGRSDQEIEYGSQILTIAVLAILLAAPVGAAAIMLSAPKLLKKKAADVELGEIHS